MFLSLKSVSKKIFKKTERASSRAATVLALFWD